MDIIEIDSSGSEDDFDKTYKQENGLIVMGSASSSSTTSTVKIPGASMGHSVRSNGDRMDEARPGYGSRVVDVEGTLFLAPDNQRRILPSSMMNYVSKPVIRWCSGSSGGSAVDPLEKKNGEVSHNGETNLTSYAVNRHDLHESVHNGIPRVGPLPSFSSINMSKGSLGVKGGSQTHQTGKLYSSTMPDLPHFVDCEAEIKSETHTKTNDRRVLPSSFDEGIATDTKILPAQFVQEKFNTFPEASMENTRKVQHIPRVGPLPSFSSINMPKGSLDVKGGSQTHQTGKLYSSTMPDLPHWVDCEAEISGETHTKTNDRRVLPSSFGEGIATDTKILHAQFVQEKFNTFPEASMENTSDINNYDSLWIHGNTMTPRLLPSSFYGKSANSLQQHVSSNGQNLLPLGDNRRTEHDERLIYHEALQNLAQRKVEDDLPEGLLVVPLLKHQKIALAWMVRKEKSAHCSGGILADDQGLGKTISMIALIQKQLTQQLRFTSVDSDFPVKPELLNLEDDGVIDSDNTEQLTGNDGIKYEPVSTSFMHRCQNPRPRAGTLIVCPSSVLQQWARELDEKVPHQGKLSVLVYHGGGRTKDPSELAKYHVVLTTYSIVTNEVPKQSIADDYEDEQKKLERYGICPYFSSNRKRKQTSNKKNKVKKKGKGLKDSQLDLGSGPLAKVRWFRVILDEAQTIKNHRTRVATACCGLRAMRRWCLSGTPLQNAIDDLFSYFRFLKYEPYAVFSNFRASIKCLISKDASKGYRKLQAVLKAVLLRRTKGTLIDGEPILKLPPKSINLEKVEFSSEERDFYLELEADSLEQFEEYAAAGTLEQNYANILLMLLRLRQACDHPLLVKGFHSDTFRTDSLDEARQLPKEMLINLLNQLDGSLAMCGVCSDPPEDAVIAKCGHAFCYQCISEHLTGDDNWCPVTGCGGVVGSDSVFSRYTLKSCISDGFDDEASTSSSPDGESISHSGYISSKVRVTMDILRSICRPSSKTDDTLICGSGSITFNASPNSTQLNSNSNVPHKAIVFSQWTGMLDLLELSLNQSLIQYRRLDGRMSLPSRDKAVKDFNNDPEVAVILMSLKAGSLGLNMVAASHVILLDMWWNPTVEDQAIDRAHRIGQTRPVTVSRLAIKDTVEDRILALQEEKRRMISSVFGEEIRGNQTTRLTSDDLKYLFNRR